MILQRGNTGLIFFCQHSTPVEQHSPKKSFSFVKKGSQRINSDFALWVCYSEATSDQEKILFILLSFNVSFLVDSGFASFYCFSIIGSIGDIIPQKVIKSQSFTAYGFILHLSHVQRSSKNGIWHLVPLYWQQGSLRGNCCASTAHSASTASAGGRPGIRIYLVFWNNYPQIILSEESFLLE